MTAQVSDHFQYQDDDYLVITSCPRQLFSPTVFGLEPVSLHTACHRGSVVYYTLKDQQLLVEKFTVGLADMDNPATLTINGVSPTTEPGKPSQYWYTNFNYLLEHTGGLLIGNHFIQDLYVHGGRPPAWKYETIIEFSFEKGHLLQAVDRSQQIADIRRNFFARRNTPPWAQKHQNSDLDALVDDVCLHRYYDFFANFMEPNNTDDEPTD